ncbi:DUF1524 domain-containing protein [Sphingomonas koreensis]|uniref:HNH endonuclease family protein n=1 Tax=Sphingomonas koreensis TaxID=93064 RepID=UPI00083256DC|nr:HNH endonuclease family protein [Sphingomonas koreensis]RSU55599.1 DUF1524 domain-containing protein [Sphingomonas koreensis]RSU64162.1 DUF1524 domain-containing protein [Sphingomonas koreensis]
MQQAEFWLAKFPSAVVARLRAEIGERTATLLRLMAFGRYLNTRMAITVVTTSQEDYAFDIFEALNTTGQPLTAFETFRPKVIETEGIAQFHYTASARHLATIEAFLDRFDKADDRQKATSSILIPFALLDNGGRLEARLAAQRAYLRTTYERLPDLAAKRSFTKSLATTSTFLKNGWQAPAGEVANPSPGGKPLNDPEAGFCFEAMRSLKHDITVAPMVRFYAEADGQPGTPATLAYEGAIKAMTAFSMMWRAAKGGTASIDNRYRTLVSGGTDAPHPLVRRQADGRPTRMPTLAELQSSLMAMLKRAKLDTREAWVAAAAQRAIYSENALAARFLLLVAMHNSVPDGDTGLITGDGRGNLDLLTPAEWYSRTTESIEHVAPQSKGKSDWPATIYDDSRVVHQIGNLLLLPRLENNEGANHSWERKRMLLGIFAAEGKAQAQERLTAAQKKGITLGKKAEAIALENHVLPLCRSAAGYAGAWDAAFISLRSQRLAELAWDRMAGWLGAKPADTGAGAGGGAAAGAQDAAPAA